jgi:nitrate reductase delta subunit
MKAPGSMLTLKALGALLAYPDADLRAALPEIGALLARERSLSRRAREALAALVAEMAAADPLELEERYVALFDRGRATSLHLFEHVHGESRDRGMAMVDLQALYARAGLRLAKNELPDYLPAVLEYLSTRDAAEVREMLGDCAHILRAVGEALRDRESGHAAVFAALLELAGEAGFGPRRSRAPVEEKSLDEEWMDEPVIFGPAGAPSCGAGDGAKAPARPR